jgi:hypothetical protein
MRSDSGLCRLKEAARLAEEYRAVILDLYKILMSSFKDSMTFAINLRIQDNA